MSLRLGTHKATWKLDAPFRITGHVWEEIETLVIEVSDGKNIGRAESVGVYYLNDEYPEMEASIESVRSDIEAGVTIEQAQALLPAGGARNALDCALWDLKTKQTGKSIWELTGVAPKPIQTVFTIGIESTPEAMAEKAARASQFPVLKVKLDNVEPVERIAAIRKARPDVALVIDANQGFDFELLRQVTPEFAKLGVSMLEQPLPRGADEELEGYASPIPICADESCLNLAELPAAMARYDMINIKLDKCGGLTEGLEIARRVNAAGKKVMVGNMMGTSLGMCPSYVVAQLCDFIDLDGPLGLASDYLGGIRYTGPDMELPSNFWGGIDRVTNPMPLETVEA